MFVTFDEHIGAGIGLLVFGFVGMIACAWPHLKVNDWQPRRLRLITLVTLLVLSANIGTGVYRRIFVKQATTDSPTDTSRPLQPPTPLESLTVSPIKLVFKDQPVGETSSSQTVIVVNRATAPRIITGINITGDFSQTNDCGIELMVGDSCSVEVRFAPSAIGLTHGDLEISCKDPLFSSVGLFAKVDFSGSGIQLGKTQSRGKNMGTTPLLEQTQSRVPPITLNGPGSAVSVNQQGGITAGTINITPTPNPPPVRWMQEDVTKENTLLNRKLYPSYQLGATSEGEQIDARRKYAANPGVIITGHLEETWPTANFAAQCDRPCQSLDGRLTTGSWQEGYGDSSDNIEVLFFRQPSSLPPGTVFKWEIHSKDDKAVKITWVRLVNIRYTGNGVTGGSNPPVSTPSPTATQDQAHAAAAPPSIIPEDPVRAVEVVDSMRRSLAAVIGKKDTVTFLMSWPRDDNSNLVFVSNILSQACRESPRQCWFTQQGNPQDLDKPPIQASGRPGITVHGPDAYALATALGAWFITHSTSNFPAELNGYNEYHTKEILWIEIGPGSLWKPTTK